jgi:hypothetical protein
MTQASLRNEGKIHLGYVYAHDPTLRSAARMVDGAATFAPLLERWLGMPMAQFGHSSPFNYVVHRDSMLTPGQFETHARRTHDLVGERVADGDYFGVDVGRPPERLSPAEVEASYRSTAVQAVYRTAEIGIDPRVLAKAVRERIAAEARICLRLETEVHGVRVEGDRIAVLSSKAGSPSTEHYDHVVNALWDGRLAVDASIGLAPRRPWLFRVKHFLIVSSGFLSLPSTTIVLGPFGDVVDYGDGSFYLSWYPSGLQGASSELQVPPWLRSLPQDSISEVRSGIVEGLASVVSGLDGLSSDDLANAELVGGVIFAWGASDIDDRGSELHSRFAIGPRSVGRYHSIDTGKLTTAPLNAHIVCNRVRSR